MAATSDGVEALRGVDLFAGLIQKSMDRVFQRMRTVEHAAGKTLAAQGQDGVAFHLLQSGTAEVLVGGKVLRTLGQGDYFD